MDKSTVLIFGSGGRESALAWKIQQSPLVGNVIVAPGNVGMTYDSNIQVQPCSLQAEPMLALAKVIQPDLIVIGPEQPLVDGVADLLHEHGFYVVGPHRLAAQLETSKIFSKKFMTEFDIPTAEYAFYDSYEDAVEGLETWDFEDGGIVIKSDALAGGKGVVLCDTKKEAQNVLFDFMKNPAVSVQTSRILFEKKLRGREISAFALLDGRQFVSIGYACDYKRVSDNDQGPNTGGMGTFTPTDIPDEYQEQQIMSIFDKVNRGMTEMNTPYQGILFAGLMIDGSGAESQVNVVEFNIRLGDPETQSLLPTIEEDIFEMLQHTAWGTLHSLESRSEKKIRSNEKGKKRAVHVVVASKGYPSLDRKKNPILMGQHISLPKEVPSNTHIFFAGVKEQEGQLVNSGGRVLGVTCVADTVDLARTGAYEIVNRIHFSGMHYRRDIAKGRV